MQPDTDDSPPAPSAPYAKLDAAPASAGGGSGRPALHWICASILVVELAERLCFYSFAGSQEFFLEQLGHGVAQSAGLNSAFTTLCYLWPLLGGFLADSYWGRYNTIVRFASVYFIGTCTCAVAALPGDARSGAAYLVGSMGFLALGTGGIKPNISNFGADQFDVSTSAGRRAQEAFYTQFYVVINIGALGSFGGLTTLCSHGGPFVPRPFGYFAAYGLGSAAMAISLLSFVCCRQWYAKKPPGGNAVRGVVLHAVSATRRGSVKAAAVCFGAPAAITGLLMTVAAAFFPHPCLLFVAFFAIISGLLAVGWGCQGDLAWVGGAARNVYVTRQQTADFLRIMPTLISVSLVFNAMFNCMTFWFQEQACQMNLQAGGSFQLNGSFFNVADCITIVALTPFILGFVNPFLDRVLGGFTRNGKLLVGCGLACASVLWAARLEVVRRSSPLLSVESECAPAGVRMSSLSAWWMAGPYAVMGLAEVYVNPTLYFLSYSQTPLRLRSTAQAVCLLMSAVSSGLFTILTSFLGSSANLNEVHLEYGYFASIALAVPFLVWYLSVQSCLVEKDFDHHAFVPDDSGAQVEVHGIIKEVAYVRTGFFKDYLSPTSPAGSPYSSPASSPASSPRSPYPLAGDQAAEERAEELGLGAGGGEGGTGRKEIDFVLMTAGRQIS